TVSGGNPRSLRAGAGGLSPARSPGVLAACTRTSGENPRHRWNAVDPRDSTRARRDSGKRFLTMHLPQWHSPEFHRLITAGPSLPHALLLAGPRGIGKLAFAR